MFVPQIVLRQLYTRGSLKKLDKGIKFSIKNRLMDTRILDIIEIYIDNVKISDTDVDLDLGSGELLKPSDVKPDKPLEFPLRQNLNVLVNNNVKPSEAHKIRFSIRTDKFGVLEVKVEDKVSKEGSDLAKIPRSERDDYGIDIIQQRQDYISRKAGFTPKHLYQFSFKPEMARGNIENFTGVVQVPLGFTSPVKVNGEYAQGEYIVPLATTEGTLVASYNRGIKVLNLCGGARATVVGDLMQRAPVFVFDNARDARDFVKWVDQNFHTIKKEAESTSSVAKLQYIDSYLSNKFAYLRFNYTTGDAAGQNMVGKATFHACNYILGEYPSGLVKNFYLESNLATDKKASQINVMRNRGKRVIAEAVLKREVLVEHMRVEPEKLDYHAKVSNIGAFISGANNNGAHSPNAITAIFIATGQDVANVAESSAGILYTEINEEGDLYISLTIPSLIVATYGGGTGLPSQRECLEIMGCYGKNQVYKFAEIVASVALAGEISLGAAISSADWVSSHEELGRNR
ncbi:MAG: hydroxymethylglutaryl-CoA reductase [Cyclobacteriaceae bacterium]|nr:hydroxymethylglutaryl-CoA reductase [Cyclobacteriaceae bacterium]